MEKELCEKLARINAEAEEIRLQIEKSEKEKLEKAKKEELNKNGEASKNCDCQNEEKTLTSSSKEQFVQQKVCTETILVVGANDTMLVLKENKWTALSLKLPKDVDAGGAVYLNGEIYIFGGFSMMKELYKLDSKVLEWRNLSDMNEKRMFITNSSLEWNGSIWVFGGANERNLKSVERYDPKEDKWTRMTDMKSPRYDAAASVHNGKFIICGGSNGSYLSSVECFDPESGIWTELTDMPAPRHHHSLVSFENRLILMGGNGKNTVWELTEGGTWKELPSMKCSRHEFGVAVVDKEIYVIGGDRESRGVEIFNGETWRDGPLLPYPCMYIPSIVIPKHLADTLSSYIA